MTGRKDKAGPKRPGSGDARGDRLARALRENLKRRKAAQRQKDDGPPKPG